MCRCSFILLILKGCKDLGYFSTFFYFFLLFSSFFFFFFFWGGGCWGGGGEPKWCLFRSIIHSFSVSVCVYVFVCLYLCQSFMSVSVSLSFCVCVCISFQPVHHDWCNKGRDMCNPVCGMVHIKEPLLLIGKSGAYGGSGFSLSLSEWSFTICDRD